MSVDERPDPSEMPRSQLEDEVEALREIATAIEFRGAEDAAGASLEDIWIAGQPIGKLIHRNRERADSAHDRLDNDGSAAPRHDRERMLPAHKMWLDVRAGDGDTIGDSQRRAAILFGQFHDRVVEDETTEADPSGQKLTLSSGQAREVLEDAGEFDSVKEASRSTITARIMREVQRLTKVDGCECESIDDCGHGVVEFRNGRPHALAASKDRFARAMENAYGHDRAGDTTDDASEQDVEATGDKVDEQLDRLTTAEVSR
jgi:hypothetical protein